MTRSEEGQVCVTSFVNALYTKFASLPKNWQNWIPTTFYFESFYESHLLNPFLLLKSFPLCPEKLRLKPFNEPRWCPLFELLCPLLWWCESLKSLPPKLFRRPRPSWVSLPNDELLRLREWSAFWNRRFGPPRFCHGRFWNKLSKMVLSSHLCFSFMSYL